MDKNIKITTKNHLNSNSKALGMIPQKKLQTGGVSTC